MIFFFVLASRTGEVDFVDAVHKLRNKRAAVVALEFGLAEQAIPADVQLKIVGVHPGDVSTGTAATRNIKK